MSFNVIKKGIMNTKNSSNLLKSFACAMVLIPSVLFSQEESGLGILAGLNFASTGALVDETTSISENPSRNVGYHLGLFGKADFGLLYLRPELKYTHTKSEYTRATLIVDKLDAPLLVGLDLHRHLSVFAGPSLQYVLDTDLEDVTIEDVQNDFTVGIQIGIGLNIENLGVDLRYERGLNENEANLTGFVQSRIDTRADQIILGFSLNI